MRLTVVRHGETIENRDRIVQGHNPGQLSDLGIQQGQEIAETLRTRKFDVIYSSDLLRCVDTTKLIIPFHSNTPLYYSDKIREISFGEYQGKPSTSVNWQALKGTALTQKAPGGESWTELAKRVVSFLNQIFEDSSNNNVLVVTHGGPMRVIRAAIDGLSLESLIPEFIPNCAIWDFEMNRAVSEARFKKILISK